MEEGRVSSGINEPDLKIPDSKMSNFSDLEKSVLTCCIGFSAMSSQETDNGELYCLYQVPVP